MLHTGQLLPLASTWMWLETCTEGPQLLQNKKTKRKHNSVIIALLLIINQPYLVCGLFNAYQEYQLRHKQVTTQHDMYVVSHAPQRSIAKITKGMIDIDSTYFRQV